MRDPKRVLHYPNLVKLYWRLFRDPRVSWVPKLILVAGFVYLVSPIDLLADIEMPILGIPTATLIVWLSTRGFIRLCPPNVVREHVMLIDQGA